MLGELLDAPPADIVVRSAANGRGTEAVVEIGRFHFVVAWRSSGDTVHAGSAIEQLRRRRGRGVKRAIPLVVVPYMGRAGAALCEAAGVGWLDLSGNARILAPGVRVHIEGRPNRFKRPGRPSSVFAPKSARIARWLLIHAGEAFTQRELSKATGVDEGLTSRVVRRLEQDALVSRDEQGAVRVAKPDALLDGFHEAYDFGKHDIFRGHVAARSGDALLRAVSETLARRHVEHAATGLAAAWLWSRFAAFRLVTIYLRAGPPPSLLEAIGFREETRGANVWLVVPNDDGVFHGASARDGIACAHPIQVYLDLKAQPERSGEAAAQLRSELLKWRSRA